MKNKRIIILPILILGLILLLCSTSIGSPYESGKTYAFYDRTSNLHYYMKDGLVYDKNWFLRYRIHDRALYDNDWQRQYFIKDDVIYSKDWFLTYYVKEYETPTRKAADTNGPSHP